MHVADQLFTASFEVEVDGAPSSPSAVFPDWTPWDRFGVVVNEPLGALGSSLLLQLAIASWYEVRPARRKAAPCYPELVVIQVGGSHGDFSYFDVWPPRKEVQVRAGDPLRLLEVINMTGVTRLALPVGPGGDQAVLAAGPSAWAEQASAKDRLNSRFLYSANGIVPDGDVQITSGDPRVQENIAQTTFPLPEVVGIRQVAERDGDDAVPVDDLRWGRVVEARAGEVSDQARHRRAEAHAEALAANGGVHREVVRTISTEDALSRLAGL